MSVLDTVRSEFGGSRAVVVTFGVLLLIPPLLFDPSLTYVTRRFVTFLSFALFATALNIVFGETDQLILFVGGIAAIGTYLTALTAEFLGLSAWLLLVPSAFVAGCFGAAVCYVAARRRFTVIVLAILTFAIQMIIVEVLVGLREVTGGSTGFPFSGLEIRAIEDAIGIHSLTVTYYVLVLLYAVAIGVYTYLRRTRHGLAFAAIRQDEFAAESIGIDVVRRKVFAGFLGTFFIALVGPFYAQSSGIVIPSLFSFAAVDVLVLIVLILGGLRTRFGPLVGAAVVVYLHNLLSVLGQWRTVVFGLMMTGLFIYFSQGIVPVARSLFDSRSGLRDRVFEVFD